MRGLARICVPHRALCSAAAQRAPLLKSALPRAPRLLVPDHIGLPDYAGSGTPAALGPEVGDPAIKTAEQIELMRATCALARDVRVLAASHVAAGVTTDELDKIAFDHTVGAGAYPSPLNYHRFPKSICTSVNEVMCHGIPDSRALQDGDIINIDVSTYLNGYHGDTSTMVAVGKVDEASQELMEFTKECLDKAIAICGPGTHFGQIGELVETMTIGRGFSVAEEFCGHGIGVAFHESPLVKHYIDWHGSVPMLPGMTFTIEPLIVEGANSDFKIWRDNWTVVSVCGSRSAQYEHTILITEDGHEVLT